MKAKMIKECEFCGKKFETDRGYQKFCSKECRHKRNDSLAKQRTQEKKNKNKNSSLIDAAVTARKMGMTYGQYQAMQTLKMMKGERNEQEIHSESNSARCL